MHCNLQRRQTEYRSQIAKLDLHILQLHYEANELREEKERLKKELEAAKNPRASYGVCKQCLQNWEHCQCRAMVGGNLPEQENPFFPSINGL